MKALVMSLVVLSASVVLSPAHARHVGHEKGPVTVKKQVSVRKVGREAQVVIQALATCGAELKAAMEGALFLGEIKVQDTKEKEIFDGMERTTVTRQIEVISQKGGGFWNEPIKNIAKVTVTGVIEDSALACDSATCTDYTCKLERF